MPVSAAEGEGLAAFLPPLLVAAQKVAATVSQGVHGRRRAGVGDSFWQFRPYREGDEQRGIDWRLSARGPRVYVREREWEAAQTVWLWVDPSPSMDWRSAQALPRKSERAALVALALAALLVRAGERIGLVGADERAAGGRMQLDRLAAHLSAERPPSAAPDGLVPPAELPRHARIVVIGDFLSPVEAVERMIVDLAGRGLSGLLLEVLDPAEVDFPYSGRLRFRGLEDEGQVLVGHAQSLRQAYREKLAAHRAAIADIAARSGWQLLHHRTDHRPEQALLALYNGLSLDRGAGGTA